MMNAKFADTAERMSEPYPADSFKQFANQAHAIRFWLLMKLTKLAYQIEAILRLHCLRYWIQNKTARFMTIIWGKF